MRFRAGALEFNATIAEASESPSAQTGQPLRTLTIQFRAQQASMHEQALDEAQVRRSGGLFSLGERDQPDLEWRVRESRSNFIGTEPWGINHHIWRIEQVERLACERLGIGSVELEPDDYAEAISDESVVRLVARAPIAEADLDALSMIAAAVPVIRFGISATPREMCVAYVWSQRPEGTAVVVRCVDAGEPRLTLDSARLSDDALGELIDLLSTKGVLDDADIEQLRRVRHAARRVSNVAGWPLTTSD